MSNVETNEPLPYWIGDVFQCWVDSQWYPVNVPREDSRRQWVTLPDGGREIQDVPYVRLHNLVRVFPDVGGCRHVVHEDNVDAECIWCGNAVLWAYRNRDAVRWHERNGAEFCNECSPDARACAHCGDHTHNDDSYTVGREVWCDSCHDCDASYCENCNDYYDSTENEDCPECYEGECDPDLIRDYSTKFRPLRMRMVNHDGRVTVCTDYELEDVFRNEVFLGLEHEMENMVGSYRTSVCAEVFAPMITKDQIMLKRDGSLSDGFELVSQPHTLEAFMTDFDWDLVRKAQAHGMRGWDVGSREVGIHIHINRKAFHTKPEHTRYNSSPHLLAFMHFIYSNIGSIKRIAGRNVHYGHMSERYLERAFNIARYGHSQDHRTQAINLMNNETVELRMFRSTMRVERIQAYLQFADAAVRYTATNRVEKMRDRFHFTDFAKWVEVQPRYKQLSDLIVEVDAVAHAPARPNIIDVTSVPDDDDDEFVFSDEDSLF